MIVRIVMVVKYQRWNHFTDEFITLWVAVAFSLSPLPFLPISQCIFVAVSLSTILSSIITGSITNSLFLSFYPLSSSCFRNSPVSLSTLFFNTQSYLMLYFLLLSFFDLLYSSLLTFVLTSFLCHLLFCIQGWTRFCGGSKRFRQDKVTEGHRSARCSPGRYHVHLWGKSNTCYSILY